MQTENCQDLADLEPFGPGIWLVSGALCTVAGFSYPTRMAIIRQGNGGLILWSPVSLSDRLRANVEMLGPVQHLIAPNSLHHIFLSEWIDAFPNAKVHAAPRLKDKRRDIEFDFELSDTTHPDLRAEVDQVVVRGNLITTEVVFFHKESRTVLFTDLLQHFPLDWFKGWRGMIARLDRMSGPVPAVPNKFRLAFVRRRASRNAIERVLQWPAEKVVFAHGAPVMTDGQTFLKSAFSWLLK